MATVKKPISGQNKSNRKNLKVTGGVTKIPTGITGFDTVLEGGIPKGRIMLIAGSTGTGKTVLISEFIYKGITGFGQPGVFVTFEERPADIIKNVKNFGWDFERSIKAKMLAFMDVSPDTDAPGSINGAYDLSALVERIKYAIQKISAKRIVLDSLSTLFARFPDKSIIRDTIFNICDELKRSGVTGMITSEKPEGGWNTLSRYEIEEYVADGVVDLSLQAGQQQFIRKLFIKKLRGTGYRSGVVEFEISGNGLVVYPKIAYNRKVSRTDFRNREKFGIEGVDRAIGGGIPQGHSVMVSGNTGTGKTLLNMKFIDEGIKQGQGAVYVALEEPVEQIMKTAGLFKMNFRDYERDNKLVFISPSLIDLSIDKLLVEIQQAVIRINARRVVIDSVSSLKSATMNEEDVRQFLIQATGFFKTRGVTTVMSYLSGKNFGAVKDQLLSSLETNEMRLSSVLDGIILLVYVERGQRVKRIFNVLKMRGSRHSPDIFHYEINNKGIIFGDRYEE